MPKAAKPFKRKGSPYWWITVPDASRNGARVKRSSRTTNFQEALTIQRRIQLEWHNVQQHGARPSRFLDDVILKFLVDTGPSKKDNTLTRLAWAAKQLRGHFRQMTINEITPEDIATYKSKRRADGVGSDTIAKELQLLNSSIKHCNHEYGWALPNVVTGRIPRQSKGRTRWLDYDEATRLLDVASRRKRAPWLHDIIVIMLNTGMRPGEALRIELHQINFVHQWLELTPEDSKNNEPAIVPLNAEAWEAIQRRLAWQRERGISSTRVFCDWRGNPIASIKTAWRLALAEAGIRDFKRHDLRHTAASWLAQSGYSLQKIAKLLRHKDSRSTARYAHLRNEDAVELTEALQIIGTNLGQQKKNAPIEEA